MITSFVRSWIQVVAGCLVALVALVARGAEAGGVVSFPLRTAAGDGAVEWNYWTPRAELAHERARVERGGGGGEALMLRAKGFESYGYWATRVAGVKPGTFYRFEALHRAEGLDGDGGSVFAVLSWYSGGASPRELQRDYVDRQEIAAGEWRRATRAVQAPEGAATVRVELGLRRARTGTVYWRDVRLEEVAAPAARKVRIATTRVVAATPPTIEANTRRMVEMLERVGPEKPDLVLLSENLSTRGVKLPLAEKAETIPGPLTGALAERAKRFRMYVATTLLERDGARFHNTAVLIDREGRIVGKYHKVHLTIGEMENGLTPGNAYPVFDTDFGRLGVVTCWDNWFSEPMRILRLGGAEIVLMPLAGDGANEHWDKVWRARAMDNGVYFVASSTVGEAPSRIIDPEGAVIAETREKFGFAIAEVDLNREWRLRYLSVSSGAGEARSLYLRERRPETYAPLLKDAEVAGAKEEARRPGS